MLTANIGSRIELVPMDPHCANITLALYRQQGAAGTEYLVHSYSRLPEAVARLEYVRQAMATLGGMQRHGDMLRYACGRPHYAATRRLFLEACKLGTGSPANPRPLTILDKKSGKTITILGTQVDAEGDTARAESIVGGLKKLAELNDGLEFPCGQPHRELIGLLLPRALNVRASLREEEAAATRGVLVAPSAQK